MEAISTSETSALSAAIDRGVKVVTLDPRFTKTAAKSSEWLPIRPGTDLAFHLAMLHVIVGEGCITNNSWRKTPSALRIAGSGGPVHARLGGRHHRDSCRYHPAHCA